VICGTDDAYGEKFAAFAKALKSELPDLKIILAGFPGDQEAAYREAGMDDYIFIKSNHYHVNAALLKELGVVSQA